MSAVASSYCLVKFVLYYKEATTYVLVVTVGAVMNETKSLSLLFLSFM